MSSKTFSLVALIALATVGSANAQERRSKQIMRQDGLQQNRGIERGIGSGTSSYTLKNWKGGALQTQGTLPYSQGVGTRSPGFVNQ